jgi:pimeloyl-ACP methyl ester carboxylesterase
MNLLVRRPAGIRSVALLEPVLVFAPLTAAAVLRSVPAGVHRLPRAWRESFTRWTANGAPVDDVPVARMIEAGMRGYALRLPAPTRITLPQLAEVKVPTLVIVAGRSPMHDAQAVAETARNALRAGEVVVYPDASHAVNGEYPDRLAADVAAFRRRLSA